MIKKLLWALLAILMIAAAIFYAGREQWVADFNQARKAQQNLFIEQGKAFGESANQQQCLTQSLELLNKCFAASCTIDHGAYLRSCLQSAAPSEGFCEQVPTYKESFTKSDKKWLKDSCWDKNANGSSCKFLYKLQMNFCSVKQ